MAVVSVHDFCLANVLVKKWSHMSPGNALGGRRVFALLLLGLFLFVHAMTQYEPLHHLFHPDSHDAKHHCAVTMLLSGQVDSPDTGGIHAVAASQMPVTVILEPVPVFLSFEFFLPLSCGPPASLS
ncbi:MAG: hypothetical protein U1F98_14845 [Verrucomicrobiota bacterium]